MTVDVIISKKNHSFIKISADPGIILELREAFSFEVPGYKFMQAYKQGRWDGKIRLLDLRERVMYSGLCNKLIQLLDERGYTYELKSSPEFGLPNNNDDSITMESITEYIKSLELTDSDGDPLEVYEYQIRAVYLGLRNFSGLMHATTGAGKSLIIYCIFRYLLESDQKMLLIVPTVALTTQMLSDFKDYSQKNGFDCEKYVHLISAGLPKKTDKNLTISTWQSLQREDPSYFEQFDFVGADEAHEATADKIKIIFESSMNAKYRMGFTGTLHDTKCHVLVMIGMMGEVQTIAKAADLIRENKLSKLKIKILELIHEPDVCKAAKKMDYQAETDYVITNSKRNKFIKNLVLKKTSGTTLVLFRYGEKQGKKLYEALLEECNDGRRVVYIDGGVDKDDREEFRQEAKEQSVIFVASFGTFKRGINVPSIQDIIYAHPNKGKITNLQSIGRGLRLHKDKTHCTLWDIADNLSIGRSINYGMLHMGERIKQYIDEEHTFSVIKVKF